MCVFFSVLELQKSEWPWTCVCSSTHQSIHGLCFRPLKATSYWAMSAQPSWFKIPACVCLCALCLAVSQNRTFADCMCLLGSIRSKDGTRLCYVLVFWNYRIRRLCCARFPAPREIGNCFLNTSSDRQIWDTTLQIIIIFVTRHLVVALYVYSRAVVAKENLL